ncbi:hypothetical protein IQ266_04525 [filamentous cyanobacterium LEGE 11480]|uniref:C2 domain-containing protein n=1 Tax=Romeriopsis navalis LEGE 11480 TaxID=2777977 RepID=A0A928Z172_9CYAN|nr:C2 domain-containing protein [Romeriopsis navalis]MBE9029026.1 hypothetical protein [Romeriopsis navalis LEGE 11480]
MKHQVSAIAICFATAGLIAPAIAKPRPNPVPRQRVIQVRVVSAKVPPKRRFNFDPGNRFKHSLPDFYVKLKVNSRQLRRTRTVKNSSVAFFRYSGTMAIPHQRRTPVKLTLMDSDPGRDDTVDIHSSPQQKSVTVLYEADTGNVYDPSGKKIGVRGQRLAFHGDDAKHGTGIIFKISHFTR